MEDFDDHEVQVHGRGSSITVRDAPDYMAGYIIIGDVAFEPGDARKLAAEIVKAARRADKRVAV